MNIEISLSSYGKQLLIPAPITALMEEIAKSFRPEKDINVGVGYVCEETIPKELIVEATRAVVDDPKRYPLAFNYGGAKGAPYLIDSIRRFLIGNQTGSLTSEVLDDKEILIGPAGATSILHIIALAMKEGIVITSDPYYYIYGTTLQRHGFEVISVPEDKEGIRTDLLRQQLARLGDRKKEISFFYFVTENNPTSVTLSNDRRGDLVSIVNETSMELGEKFIPAFFDTAYECLVHGEPVPPLKSALHFDAQTGLIYEIGTISKILSPALQIGWIIGDNSPFMSRVIPEATAEINFSASAKDQAIVSYLLDHHARDQLSIVNEWYREKAREVGTCIDSQLGEYLEVYTGGQAGLYYYLTFKDIDTSPDSHFFKFLTRTTGDPSIDGPSENKKPKVSYIPGEYCVNDNGKLVDIGKRQLRLSYAFEGVDRIKQAICLMGEAAQYALSMKSR